MSHFPPLICHLWMLYDKILSLYEEMKVYWSSTLSVISQNLKYQIKILFQCFISSNASHRRIRLKVYDFKATATECGMICKWTNFMRIIPASFTFQPISARKTNPDRWLSMDVLPSVWDALHFFTINRW